MYPRVVPCDVITYVIIPYSVFDGLSIDTTFIDLRPRNVDLLNTFLRDSRLFTLAFGPFGKYWGRPCGLARGSLGLGLGELGPPCMLFMTHI